MRIILLTIISFLISFNAYAASPQLKPIMKKNPAHIIKAIPKTSSQITIAKPDLFVIKFELLPDPAKSGGICHYYLTVGNKGTANPIKKNIRAYLKLSSQPSYAFRSIKVVAPNAGQAARFCAGCLSVWSIYEQA